MTQSDIDELETMTVHRETSVGWDEQSLTNETVDEDGNHFIDRPGFAAGDPRAPLMRMATTSSIDPDLPLGIPVRLCGEITTTQT